MIRTLLSAEMFKQGCTIPELAKVCNVSESTVYKWRIGEIEPTAANKKQIAQYLAVKPYSLWPAMWKLPDISEEYDSVNQRIMLYNYKADYSRFQDLCRRRAALSVKLYVRNRRKMRTFNSVTDDYCTPYNINILKKL